MSIHHEVTIHCDGCGHWLHADGQTAAQRRRLGWRNWRGANGHHRHPCPRCTQTAEGDPAPTDHGGAA